MAAEVMWGGDGDRYERDKIPSSRAWVWFRFHQTLLLPRSGQCTGANSTLNKGATGLPLRASAVVGH